MPMGIPMEKKTLTTPIRKVRSASVVTSAMYVNTAMNMTNQPPVMAGNTASENCRTEQRRIEAREMMRPYVFRTRSAMAPWGQCTQCTQCTLPFAPTVAASMGSS